MANPTSGGDFETLARQYWNQWGETMRSAAPPPAAQPATPGWNEAIGWWSQLAQGGSNGADEAVQRFDTQARGWFGQMQQLAAQFAGRQAGASDIADAWRQMLGGAAGNPFAEVFKHMGGRGQHGPEQWVEQAAPFIEALQRQGGQAMNMSSMSMPSTDMPAFGFAREHQERWQKLAQAQRDYQQRHQDYHALMAEAGQAAFKVFEDKLAERSEPGRQLASARALFDLWIDAAEEAYAQIALSPRFREVYGEFINAQMRLRGAVQGEIEQACQLVGMPTRTEIDATHRKIVQLERELRRLRDAFGASAEKRAGDRADNRGPKKSTVGADLEPSIQPSPGGRGSSSVAKEPVRNMGRNAVKKAAKKITEKAVEKAVARKTPVAKKPAATKKTAARKTAAKPASKKVVRSAAKRAVSKTAKRKR